MFVDQFLDTHQLHVSRFRHAAANTCAEFKALVPSLGGTHNKNLFLQDKKGRRHFLVITQPEHEVDLLKLGEQLVDRPPQRHQIKRQSTQGKARQIIG